jgi:hypothetical protein
MENAVGHPRSWQFILAFQRLSFMVPAFSIARAFNRGQAEFMLPEGQSSG